VHQTFFAACGDSPEFWDLDYKIEPIFDHVAKLHGDLFDVEDLTKKASRVKQATTVPGCLINSEKVRYIFVSHEYVYYFHIFLCLCLVLDRAFCRTYSGNGEEVWNAVTY